MEAYTGFAQVYDLFMDYVPYGQWSEYVISLLKEFGVEDKQIVSVKISNADRSTVFGDVVVRVNENFAPAMHIDTDESNAAACAGEVFGEIVK